MDDPEALTARFRGNELKVTPQRQCIFEILFAHPEHHSAEAVFDMARTRMPTISLKTVYETLHSLAAMGQIQQIDLGTGSALFDPNVERHQHLVCSQCGRISDVEIDLDVLTQGAAEPYGFVPEYAEMIVRGLCSDCAGDAEVGPAEVGPAEVGPAEVRPRA